MIDKYDYLRRTDALCDLIITATASGAPNVEVLMANLPPLPEYHATLLPQIFPEFIASLLKPKNCKSMNAFAVAMKHYMTELNQGMEDGKPLVDYFPSMTTEILFSMGLNPISYEVIALFLAAAFIDGVESELEFSEEQGFPVHTCGMQRAPVAAIEKGLLPKPACIIKTTAPCNSSNMVYQYAMEKEGIPLMIVDTPYHNENAFEYFTIAIEKDPDWAPPYAGVAAFWIGVRQMGLAPSSITVPNIYKYLNKTIELDPNSALTHFTTAGAAVSTGYDWEKGESEFLKVIELNPNDAGNRAYYAHLLLFLKRHDEALTQAQLALELDPLNPMIQGFVAVVYWHIGNYDQAIELAKQILLLVPNHPLAIGVLWGANDLLGNYEESLRYCVKQFGLDEANSALVTDQFRKQGYKAALEKFISIVEAIPDEQISVSAGIRIAWMYLEVDKIDEALNILEKVLEEQGPDLPYVTTGSEFYYKLESEPRFLAILEKMGLPPPLPR